MVRYSHRDTILIHELETHSSRKMTKIGINKMCCTFEKFSMRRMFDSCYSISLASNLSSFFYSHFPFFYVLPLFNSCLISSVRAKVRFIFFIPICFIKFFHHLFEMICAWIAQIDHHIRLFALTMSLFISVT